MLHRAFFWLASVLFLALIVVYWRLGLKHSWGILLALVFAFVAFYLAFLLRAGPAPHSSPKGVRVRQQPSEKHGEEQDSQSPNIVGDVRVTVGYSTKEPPPAECVEEEPDEAAASQTFHSREIFYVTDRLVLMKDGRRTYGDRHPQGYVSYGKCSVSIPISHRIGHLETPSIWKLEFKPKPEKHVVVLEVEKLDKEAFFDSVKAAVESAKSREAFVFIHGYNVSFQDAARRTAQMAFDLGFVGAPIFYSWPSAGNFWQYTRDETNVEWTIPHLKAFLTDLAARVSATTIHLIAHSMGNRALARALEQMAGAGEANVAFRHIILTAPDIDADTFRTLAAAMRPVATSVTMYSSHLDKALMASKRFHGYPRAGEVILIVGGVDTIDASAVNTSFLGHSHFGESRSVIEDIYWLLRNQPPENRFGITRKQSPDGNYYVFRP